jgi:hypothetical protein
MPNPNYTLFVLVPRAGLWDRLNRLWSATDWRERFHRLARLEDPMYTDTRLEGVLWRPQFFQLINQPLEEAQVQRMVQAVEAGASRLYDHGGLGFAQIRIGQHDPARQQEEQLLFDLGIDSGTLQGAQRGWQQPDECLLTVRWPTGSRGLVRSHSALRTLLAVAMELLDPSFAFSCPLESSGGFDDGRTYRAPWSFRWTSMLYGAQLSREIGVERLRATPSFRVLELQGPMFWISGPSGLGDERFYLEAGDFMAKPYEAHGGSDGTLVRQEFYYAEERWMRVFDTLERDHQRSVVKHLGLIDRL